MIAQQPDLHGVLVEERGREALDALTQNGSGDRPAQRVEMALFLRGDFLLAEKLPGVRVDGREGVGALVDIRSDRNHPARPLDRWVR